MRNYLITNFLIPYNVLRYSLLFITLYWEDNYTA